MKNLDIGVPYATTQGVGLINATPHHLTAHMPNGDVIQIPVSGLPIPRVAEAHTPTPIDGFQKVAFGKVTDLPSCPKGFFLVVSGMVRDALLDDARLISPGPLVRDDQGQPRGCKGFFVSDAAADRLVRIASKARF